MGHNHTHNHHNHAHHELHGRNLSIAIFLNVLITLAQILGALFSKSLSLLTDALHNLSDVMTLLISWGANKLSKLKSTPQQSFGYRRAEILAAFINATILLGISIYLIIESVSRLFSNAQPTIESNTVICLAVLGIAVNGLSVLFMQKDAKSSMNMKAAYLHMFSDMLTSIAVLIGGIMMKYFSLYWIDSVLSILISIYLIISSYRLVVEATKVLMQFAPANIDLEDVIDKIIVIEGIKGLHHVHIWQLDDNGYHFESHVDMEEDLRLSEVDMLLEDIRFLLEEQYHINHATLQAEFSNCDDKSLIKQIE